MSYDIIVLGGSWEFSNILCQINCWGRQVYFTKNDIDTTLSFRIVKTTKI